MSSHSIEQVRCQACGHEQAFTIWASLNAKLDPKAKSQLVKGELHSFTCASCGDVARLEYNLLYHDMERHWMVWLLPSGDWPGSGPSLSLSKLPPAGEGYRLRVVRSFNELLEKIYIADADMDDLVVEVIKLFLWQNIREEEGIDDGILLFSGTRQGDEEPELTFVLLSEGKKGRFAISQRQFYDELVRDHPELFNREVPKTSNWLQVDAAYATQQLEG